mmetsp:Transcript_193/g.168  ORF Transcript_193/g.168 Transcript_193/m.168 type:complete len:218 (+) Transcript_193:2-655(+)
MLHILNLVLQRSWMSEIVIEYLYGFHAFHDDGNVSSLIKNIIHGTNFNESVWKCDIEESSGHEVNEWSSGDDDEEQEKNENLDINNLKDLEIPTDKGMMGISSKIVSTPDVAMEKRGTDLLNDFMEEKYVDYRRTDNDGMCVCHEDDRGFIRMWDELNLDVVKLQYDAFKKGQQSQNLYKEEIKHQHSKVTRSMEFYFDFIRSLHYDTKEEDIEDSQ